MTSRALNAYHSIERDAGQRLARNLGWFSIGLGVARVSGALDNKRSRTEIRRGSSTSFPMAQLMNRSISIRTGQCHVDRYMKPLLERVQKGEIDPSFVITHRMPLEDAPAGFRMFRNKQDNCEKIVIKPQQRQTH